MECTICCDQIKGKHLVCPNCSNLFCLGCQKRFAKGECMSCHMKFKNSLINDVMGKSFMEKIIKPKIIEELMVEQKETLKYVQPLVDWEKEVREQKKNLRFGIHMSTPERPKISSVKSTTIVFPCPCQDCRGFVNNGICGVCKTNICTKCREKKNTNHVCKIEDIQSISLLMTDSKQCPRCCTMIYRTQGCNHMYCTNCQTHFDWVSGKVIQISTNGHYLNLQRYSQNVPVRENVSVKEPNACENDNDGNGRGFSLYYDRVSIDNIDISQMDQVIIQCIWHDSNAIRLVKRKKYNETDLESDTREALQELQIRFMLGEITEVIWRRHVYQHYQRKTLALLYADILNIYLSTIDMFQSALLSNSYEQYSILEQYTKLVELCNDSFKSIQEEYNGPLHHIRHPQEDLIQPSFV